MPGYNNQHLIDGMIVTFLTNPFPDKGPETDEYKATLELVERIAVPVHEHIVSWWNEEGGGIFPDEMVKMTKDDPISGYLSDKIDGDTIKYNDQTFKLYVNNIPLASTIKRGGIIVGHTMDSVLYLQGDELLVRVNRLSTLSDANNEVPSCRAVKLYVDNAIQGISSGGGVGDMLKSTYDTNNNGIVDNSEKLANQVASYYLEWDNLIHKPLTYTPSAHDILDHTSSGLTAGYFLKSTGTNSFGFVPHGLTYLDVNAEEYLGTPLEDNYVLTSTTAGVRSWVDVDTIGLSWKTAPLTKTSTGIEGQIARDSNYFYICILTNTWVRCPMITNW